MRTNVIINDVIVTETRILSLKKIMNYFEVLEQSTTDAVAVFAQDFGSELNDVTLHLLHNPEFCRIKKYQEVRKIEEEFDDHEEAIETIHYLSSEEDYKMKVNYEPEVTTFMLSKEIKNTIKDVQTSVEVLQSCLEKKLENKILEVAWIF